MELKPCPWCGSDKIVFGGSPGHMYLSCIGCNAEGPYGDFSEAEAIAAWNRRTPSSEGDGRDGERYRWLRHATLLSSPTPVITKGVYLDGRHIGNESLWGANADAAIDAAIAAAEGDGSAQRRAPRPVQGGDHGRAG